MLAATAGTASAASSVAVAVGIDSTAITSNGGPGGNCTWLVKTTVTIVNLTTGPVTIADINGPNGRVVWSYPNNSGVVTPNITMTGGVVGANAKLETAADATFTIPCDAMSGDLAIDFHVTVPDQPETTLSGDAPFLVDGTALPSYTAIAGLLFVGGLGAFLFLRLARSPKSFTRERGSS